MSDPQATPPAQPPQIQVQMQMSLPPESEVGIFGDFTNVWHTPNSFVLDFLSLKVPQHPLVAADGSVDSSTAVLETRIAARVRIPPEQIFPLIQALQTQGSQWLAETGRSEPPSNWAQQQ